MTLAARSLSGRLPPAFAGRFSLAWQFVLAGVLVLLLGMGSIGLWVTARIKDSVTRNAATSTALYVDSIVAPLTQELSTSQTLGEGARLALTETLGHGVLGGRLVAFKIWKPDGTVIFSNESELVGRRFTPTDGLSAALSGEVHAEFDSLDDDENATEQNSPVPLLEIYSPIREPWSGRVIGVMEFYEAAGELEDDLREARLRSWLVVAVVTSLMLAVLFGIVARGSRLIATQQGSLKRQVSELSHLLSQNQALRARVEQASHRAASLNERYLRRISADLHDGPAQLLAFALLRLEGAAEGKAGDAGIVRNSLEEAMREIRDICRGLTLPELDALDPEAVLRRAASGHATLTSSHVEMRVDEPLPALPQAAKICLYRFVRETLSNAARHGGAAGQSVSAKSDGAGGIVVSVADRGEGFDVGARTAGKDGAGTDGLGLAGLEERIASLGGRLAITSVKGQGTTVSMHLPQEFGHV